MWLIRILDLVCSSRLIILLKRGFVHCSSWFERLGPRSEDRKINHKVISNMERQLKLANIVSSEKLTRWTLYIYHSRSGRQTRRRTCVRSSRNTPDQAEVCSALSHSFLPVPLSRSFRIGSVLRLQDHASVGDLRISLSESARSGTEWGRLTWLVLLQISSLLEISNNNKMTIEKMIL